MQLHQLRDKVIFVVEQYRLNNLNIDITFPSFCRACRGLDGLGDENKGGLNRSYLCRNCHNEFQNASGEMSEIEFQNFLSTAFVLAKDFSKDNSLHYVFMDWRHSLDLQLAFKDIYPKLLNICIWDKTKSGLGSFYRSQHEFCCIYQNGNGGYSNNIQLGKNGRNRSNIWQYQGMNLPTKQANKLGKLHPTVKSTAMIADIILDTTKQGDLILDHFGGSGTTLIAAQQTNRVANLIEISPHYCNAIIHRWEEMTGMKHTKLGELDYGEEKEKKE